MTALESFTTTVDCPDGTAIGLHSIGSGPDVVVVHGAMQTGLSHSDLAGLLSDGLRVHLMDRRGRGSSGGDPVHGSGDEVRDVRAVLDATGATRVFGVSSGAIIAARAALADARIRRLALFEPPLSIDGSVPLELTTRVDDAIARGDLPTAMALGMKVAEMGPAWMFRLPVPVLAAFSRARLRSPGMRSVASGLGADLAVVRDNADKIADFADLAAQTLLIDGTATRPYLRAAVAALAAAVPGARHVELAGQWHGVTSNTAEHGRPHLIAPVLAEFFA
ncbi:alpha/beta fold hydrolase [Pengzhenrongella sicca]|uniref:Alpha/beta hydrolase n=1 Tax=Pengzhenrongella sicca TaxID=2819238 RepID=A0A8A4ZKY1_9MICO|nr:alpha/beta hydrolase [Pengzhenrongella sicca]QTE31166.1 alpha/beta hydrolase [Pengzhenrongella sicca]